MFRSEFIILNSMRLISACHYFQIHSTVQPALDCLFNGETSSRLPVQWWNQLSTACAMVQPALDCLCSFFIYAPFPVALLITSTKKSWFLIFPCDLINLKSRNSLILCFSTFLFYFNFQYFMSSPVLFLTELMFC